MGDGALVDIVGPSAPLAAAAVGHGWLWTAAMVALLVGAALLGWRLGGGRARRSLRRLGQIRAAFRAGTLADRDAAYLLALELRRTLGTERLAADRPPPFLDEGERAAWPDFVGRLDALRYQPPPVCAAEIEQLFARARAWLRRCR